MIICRSLLVIPEMIIGNGAQKIAYRNFREKLGARVQRLDREFIVLILIGYRSQIAVHGAQIRLQLNGADKFLLRLGKFPLLHQRMAEYLMKLSIIAPPVLER